MTIAAGFNFTEGVLLCADTKYTGSSTLYEPKLFRKEYENGSRSVIGLSGNYSYAKMAISKIENAIKKISNPSLDDMAGAVEKILIKVHKEHITPHPDRGLSGGPDFWLLLGLWSPKDGLGSYYTNQTAIDTFDLYQCIGSGEYLARYIIKPRYRGKYADLKRAVFVACIALSRIKAYDADCGGNSEFVVLNKAGNISEIEAFDISQNEEFSNSFFLAADYLYTVMSDLELDSDEVEKAFEHFRTMVVMPRDKHLQDRARRKALFDALAPLANPGIAYKG